MTETEEAKFLLTHVFNKEDNKEYWTLNGEYDGEYKEWYDNGQLKDHCFFITGRARGKYKSWYDNGKIRINCIYDDNGYYINTWNESKNGN